MKFTEFSDKVIAAYMEKFPTGYCKVSKYICLGRSITIDMYLSGKSDKHSVPTMGDNDMFHVCFAIELPDRFDYEADELPDKMTLENWSRFYLLKPDSPYMAFGKRIIHFRKTTGTAEKLIPYIGKFIENLHEDVKSDYNSGMICDKFINAVSENLTV